MSGVAVVASTTIISIISIHLHSQPQVQRQRQRRRRLFQIAKPTVPTTLFRVLSLLLVLVVLTLLELKDNNNNRSSPFSVVVIGFTPPHNTIHNHHHHRCPCRLHHRSTITTTTTTLCYNNNNNNPSPQQGGGSSDNNMTTAALCSSLEDEEWGDDGPHQQQQRQCRKQQQEPSSSSSSSSLVTPKAATVAVLENTNSNGKSQQQQSNTVDTNDSSSSSSSNGAYHFLVKTVQRLQQQEQQRLSAGRNNNTVIPFPRLVADKMGVDCLVDSLTQTAAAATVVVVPINSLVFSITMNPEAAASSMPLLSSSSAPYVLAVLPSRHRVNVSKLQHAVMEALQQQQKQQQQHVQNNKNNNDDGDSNSNNNDNDNDTTDTATQLPVVPSLLTLSLTPSDQLRYTCGFEAGTVPPMGLCPSPELILVEESLLQLQLQQDQGQQQEQQLIDPDDIGDQRWTSTYTSATNSSSSIRRRRRHLLLAGGGKHGQSVVMPLEMLLAMVVDAKTTTTTNTQSSSAPAVQQPRVQACSFREESLSKGSGSSSTTSNSSSRCTSLSPNDASPDMGNDGYAKAGAATALEIPKPSKPFFVVAPPSRQQVQAVLRRRDDDETKDTDATARVDVVPLQPEWVSFVGTITAVRHMARRLVFVDIAPPGGNVAVVEKTNLDTHPDVLYPWKNPSSEDDAGDMAVQLIIGKTYCQRRRLQAMAETNSGLALQQAEQSLRQLKVGQWIFVQGKTNVGNQSSLQNWIQKSSLDVVVFDLEWVSRPTSILALDRKRDIGSPNAVSSWGLRPSTPSSSIVNPKQFLSLSELYPPQISKNDAQRECKPTIRLVDSEDSIAEMSIEISEWLEKHPADYGFVGIDSEWKPNFLAADDDNEVQPVLLLQICIHPLSAVYLVDLQALLRPLQLPSESMNGTEQRLSDTLELVFGNSQFIKVGFQVLNDLQKLAASYPHVSAFERVESILETSKFAVKVLQINKLQGFRQVAMSSLNTLVEYLFLGKVLDKKEQISDWSQRPLSSSQQEYAAMDAAIVVEIAVRLLHSVGAAVTLQTTTGEILKGDFFPMPSSPSMSKAPLLQRWDNDAAFSTMITSSRFLYLDATEDAHAVSQLRAKQHIGGSSSWSPQIVVATQTWISGQPMPDVPTFSMDGTGAYTDLQGTKRIPSQSLDLDEDAQQRIQELVGTRMAKSKHGCILSLLRGHPLVGDGTAIDFPQRSGYAEMQNGVALFVTLPVRPGNKRSYPNQWLEDGAILSWFLRGTDWADGTSRIAKKLLASQDDNSSSSQVILFARRGKGHFLCCGRCRVTESPNGRTSDGNLVKLFLLLQDWSRLYAVEEFRSLVD